MQDSQRRCRTRNDLQQARIAAQSQDSQRRAWTRSAEARIAAHMQDSHAAERRERSSHRRRSHCVGKNRGAEPGLAAQNMDSRRRRSDDAKFRRSPASNQRIR